MAGQARLNIREKQWDVDVAVTPWELIRGLGGIPELPARAGMLFDLGWPQTIQVTTVPMHFPLDIAFLSEALVITEVYCNIEPGYLVTSTLPARYFLEVNAGELQGIESGDVATVELIAPAQTTAPDWASALFGLIGFMVIAMLTANLAKDLLKGTEEKREFERGIKETVARPYAPSTEKTTREIEVMKYRVEKNKPYDTWAVVELWPGGTIRTPFESKEAAINREEEIGEYYGWKLQGMELTQAQENLLDPQRFPERKAALEKLRGYDVIDVHDDGDLTVRSRGKLYVVTTEGRVFEQAYLTKTKSEPVKPGVMPVERTKTGKNDLEYFADSPEYLTETIDDIGYRDKIDSAFEEAIQRAKGTR